jgi:hypothetical protein
MRLNPFKRMLKQQRLHGFRFIPFIQWERYCCFAVPSHAVPDALAMSSNDPEFGDRGLMPVFDLAQDRFEILANRQLAFACNRDRADGTKARKVRRRRYMVTEFSPCAGLVAHHDAISAVSTE